MAISISRYLSAQQGIEKLLAEIQIPKSYWIDWAIREVTVVEKRALGVTPILPNLGMTPIELSDAQFFGFSTAFAPRRTVREAMFDVQGPELEPLVRLNQQLEGNAVLASHICRIVGPENLAIRKRELRPSRLFGAVVPTREDLNIDTLQREAMVAFLRLREPQTARCRSLARELRQAVRATEIEYFRSLKHLNRDQMREYLQELDGSQREQVEQVIGQPVE